MSLWIARVAQRPMYAYSVRALLGILLFVLVGGRLFAQQQIADPDFEASVARPAYAKHPPTVAIDAAHANTHTASGQFKPFAELLRADGYHVVEWTRTFDAKALAEIEVLVIANARDLEALMRGVLESPAFTEEECDAVRDWVRAGGALLLIADHAPFGHAMESLGARFGLSMGKGWAFDHAAEGGITTQLVFSRENGLLGDHPIVQGRDSEETITSVRSFTGQSIGADDDVTILMKLSDTAREAATPDDLNASDAAVRGGDTDRLAASSTSVAGRAQGVAMTFGRGRVVALGEAGMFSAQIVRYPDGSERRFGMNIDGYDNRQLALNVVRWLSGALE
ncbi:MAG TPA: DUF4350 domain-containing protein [Thermoanaerobaculia bacterium]|nr:DUF4350 domain-containing protein [Thermoanaerobaculia bacterium]